MWEKDLLLRRIPKPAYPFADLGLLRGALSKGNQRSALLCSARFTVFPFLALAFSRFSRDLLGAATCLAEVLTKAEAEGEVG